MRCGSCGWDNPAGIIFCTNCGKRMSDRAQPAASAVVTPASGNAASAAQSAAAGVSPGTQVYDSSASEPVRCSRCGAASARGLRFCRDCGAALASAPTPVSSMPVVVAPSGPIALDATPPIAKDAAHCWRCQQPRDGSAAFCRYCGAQLNDPGAFQPAGAKPAAAPAHGSMPGQGSWPLATSAAPSAALPTADSASSFAYQPQPGAQTQARLVTLLKDGSEGRSIALGEGDADIGSNEGDITFPDDPYLSPRHARLCCRAGTYTLRDLDSVNGVYVRLRESVELRDRDMVLIGQQVLRFELLQDGELPLGPAYQRGVLVFGTPEAPRFARLVQYTTEGVGRDVHYLCRDETVIGRENGDIVFTDDPFLSRRHAAIRVDHAASRFTLHDLGSSNGTAARIRGEHVLRDGDQFRIGRHLFRFEAGPGGRAGR
jgi:pSer/pThr/pTyr-binding forkhead associated (FHA) protein